MNFAKLRLKNFRNSLLLLNFFNLILLKFILLKLRRLEWRWVYTRNTVEKLLSSIVFGTGECIKCWEECRRKNILPKRGGEGWCLGRI